LFFDLAMAFDGAGKRLSAATCLDAYYALCQKAWGKTPEEHQKDLKYIQNAKIWATVYYDSLIGAARNATIQMPKGSNPTDAMLLDYYENHKEEIEKEHEQYMSKLKAALNIYNAMVNRGEYTPAIEYFSDLQLMDLYPSAALVDKYRLYCHASVIIRIDQASKFNDYDELYTMYCTFVDFGRGYYDGEEDIRRKFTTLGFVGKDIKNQQIWAKRPSLVKARFDDWYNRICRPEPMEGVEQMLQRFKNVDATTAAEAAMQLADRAAHIGNYLWELEELESRSQSGH